MTSLPQSRCLEAIALYHPVIDDLFAGGRTPPASTDTAMLWPKLFPYRQRSLVSASAFPVIQTAASPRQKPTATQDPLTEGSDESQDPTGRRA